jgi:hypothetical protein
MQFGNICHRRDRDATAVCSSSARIVSSTNNAVPPSRREANAQAAAELGE